MPRTNRKPWAQRRNHVKFRINGFIAQFRSLISHDETTSWEKVRFRKAMELMDEVLYNWEGETRTLRKALAEKERKENATRYSERDQRTTTAL